MEKQEIKLIIANSPPFNKLGPRQLNRFIDICEVKEYKSTEVIYKEASAPDYFYFLLKGRVAVSAKSGLEENRIEIIKRGTSFGIISMLTDDPHSVTARSIEVSFVLRIEKAKFREFLRKNPSVSMDFFRLLSQRVKARHKPKSIFQSKRIGVMGSVSSGKTTYMIDLARQLKEQALKSVITVQLLLKESQALDFEGAGPLDYKYKDKILDLENFTEAGLANYIIQDKIDYLYIKASDAQNFSSLLNFLSENYHFVLYEIPHDFLSEYLGEFTFPAHHLHFFLLPDKQELAKGAYLIKKLKEQNPLNAEKIKVVLSQIFGADSFTYEAKHKILNHSIYATLLSRDCDSYHKAVRRIARQIGEVVLGLALGSGAAYGFSHIGVLKVLEQNKVAVDVICGSSMGAIIAALWAAGYSIEDIEKLAYDIGRKVGSFSIFGVAFPFKGFIKARRLEGIFKSIFKDMTFYDLKRSLKIVAFDFRRRETVILEEGHLYKALAASCAFPGIFEPVRFKKDILLDGGILNPLPTKTLLKYNVHKIIASNITLSPEQAFRESSKRNKFHIFDFIFGSVETMQQHFVEDSAKLADIVIHTNLEGLGWMEFDKMGQFVRRGEAAAIGKLEEIKSLITH